MPVSKPYAAATWATVGMLGVGLLAQAPAPAGKQEPTEQATPATPSSPAKGPQKVTPAQPTQPAPSGKATVGPDEVVLTIGPEKITRARFEQIKKGVPPQFGRSAQQFGDKAFANNYGSFRGLALLAQREKLDQRPEFEAQLDFMRTQLLATLVIENLQARAEQISEEELKAFYDANQADFEQARMKAIFVAFSPTAKPAAGAAASSGASAAKPEPPKARTEEETRARAEELRQQLLAGADFAALASAHSDHKQSAQKGGDFGTMRRKQLPASLAKVVFSLKPNEISEPVKEGPGYYILQAQDIRPVTLDEAAATIRRTLQQQKFLQTMQKVKQEFPVVLNEKFFGQQATQTRVPGTGRPVITGIAPAKPQAAGAPAPASPAAPVPATATKADKKKEKKK